MKKIAPFTPTSQQRAWIEIQSDKLECSYTAYIKRLIDEDMKRNKFKHDNAECAFFFECAEQIGVSLAHWYKNKDEI